MKLDALDHPKTLDFAARLNVELPTAIGYLELLWAFTGKKAPQGNIGKWPDGAIARACYWMGDPAEFVAALLASGFVDADEAHRYVIHDWHEHAPRWVKAKLKSLGQSFVGTTGDTVVETVVETIGRPSKGSQAKRSEAKGREGEEDSAEHGSPPPADPVVIAIPLNTGDEFPVTEAKVQELADLYPAVDVPQALRNMRGWCLGNPKRRKTRGGVMDFITTWLAKDQNRGGQARASPQAGTQRRNGFRDIDYEQEAKDMGFRTEVD
jgi:hypothetical protein